MCIAELHCYRCRDYWHGTRSWHRQPRHALIGWCAHQPTFLVVLLPCRRPCGVHCADVQPGQCAPQVRQPEPCHQLQHQWHEHDVPHGLRRVWSAAHADQCGRQCDLHSYYRVHHTCEYLQAGKWPFVSALTMHYCCCYCYNHYNMIAWHASSFMHDHLWQMCLFLCKQALSCACCKHDFANG